MEKILFICGIFTYFFLGILVICLTIAGVATIWKWATEKHDNHIWHSAHDNFINRLAIDSYWFSEDYKTMRAFQIYCNAFSRGGVNISQVRDEWRSEFSLSLKEEE